MDTDALAAHARARLDHARAQRVTREKYEAKMIFGHNGGMFRAAPDMITLLSLYGDQLIVVKDLYDQPVEVKADQLCGLMRTRWQEQMTAWLVEHQDLRRQK